jgi:hypothetical protein
MPTNLQLVGSAVTMPKLTTFAILETHHFTFYAFGESQKHVLELLAEKWETHKENTGATFEFEDLRDSVFIAGMKEGAFYSSDLPNPPQYKKVKSGGITHLVSLL